MTLIKLFAEIQFNPRNKAAYHKIIDHYRATGMTNEADAFLELTRKKFNVNNPYTNEEQQSNNQKHI